MVIERVLSSFILNNLAVNPQAVPAFISASSTVTDPDPGHTLYSNPSVCLGANLVSFLILVPVDSTFNSDVATNHNSDLYEAGEIPK
ncbi:hypothetical protein EVAR_75335_1 [Eumeta japonica]|uniref:Uncharacterized protein n=1 Tax=Eumeta variegata TaxID=151549 RepID=A0A4C1XXM3_EUMVA|nr:hypothetical protein EVAR_75335_1 [Eumeta japonica]